MTATEQDHGVFIYQDGKRVGHISFGGDPLTLTAYGKTYRFSWHRYLGPLFLNKDGSERKVCPGEHNPWWDGFHLWIHQGQQTKNGVCVWKPEQAKGLGVGE